MFEAPSPSDLKDQLTTVISHAYFYLFLINCSDVSTICQGRREYSYFSDSNICDLTDVSLKYTAVVL